MTIPSTWHQATVETTYIWPHPALISDSCSRCCGITRDDDRLYTARISTFLNEFRGFHGCYRDSGLSERHSIIDSFQAFPDW